MDDGMLALATVMRLHQQPVDVARLEHEFASREEACAAPDLVRAACRMGWRARTAHIDPARIDHRVLPVIACARDGGFIVLARSSAADDGTPVFLAQRPGEAPVTLATAELDALCTGELILLRPRGAGPSRAARKFNLHWFLPALSRYRALFGEVLVASLFLQLFALVTPLFFQVVMDKVLVHRGFSTLDVLAVGFAVVVVFDALLGGLRNYLFSHTTNRVDIELGARLFHHLTALPLAYFEARQTGQTVARVRELETIRNFITGGALTLVVDIAFTAVFITVLWYYSPTLTWVVLGALPFYVALSAVVTPVLRARLERKFRTGAANQAFLTETVTGMRTVKAQALEPRLQRHWEEQLADYVAASFGAQNLGNIANQCAGLIGKIVTLLIVWWGAHLVIAGALTVGQLVAFNMIAGRVTGPILQLVQLWQEFQQAGISLRRLGDILNTPVEPGAHGSRSSPAKPAGALRFERVRFRYRPGTALVLDELDLDIPAGAVVGVVGRSGSGKSTLASLLQRLYLPEAGRVLLDGVDLAAVDTAWLRRHVGVVQQESFLFDRSVRDNIALTDPGQPFERVVQCAQLAGAHEFILQLPEAYDTLVGEQGCTLSGGQRQRLAIARALLFNPSVLVMDEATSALDYESERVIQENLGGICAGRTVLMIAHRLSTVRHCDRIVVLDGGRIAESGSHEELMEAGGYYARLYSYQSHTPLIRRLADTPQQGAQSAASADAAGTHHER